jgi:Capsule polysaccharide biosynthesis protein
MAENRAATVVFTTLAMNQTLFFEALARALEEKGVAAAHIAFHERSHEYLTRRGQLSFNAFAAPPDGAVDWRALGIDNPSFLLSHEKAAFEIADTARLLAKFASYARAVTAVIEKLLGEGRRLSVVQELGGFTSILATFHAARARGIDNWFLEPSFFRGRLLLVRNSLAALPIGGPSGKAPSAEVRAYLAAALQRQSAIVPAKDTHHYRQPWRKIADRRHLLRLVEKVRDKYLLGKREEFAHIGGHVWRHARMAGRSLLLKPHYRPLEAARPFIYYPLHVPADVAVTLRSPHYLDQYALIDYLCRVTPAPYKVAIKEHPALVGAIDYRRIRGLLAARDNLLLLDAGINNYRILEGARAVVTINSKSGAEALLLAKPVVVLGDAFYRPCSLVVPVEKLQDLEACLRTTLASPRSIAPGEVLSYFQDVWEHTFPGELYLTEPANIAACANSLLRVLLPQAAAAPR